MQGKNRELWLDKRIRLAVMRKMTALSLRTHRLVRVELFMLSGRFCGRCKQQLPDFNTLEISLYSVRSIYDEEQ